MTKERAQYLLSNTVIGGDLKYSFKREYCFQGGIVHPDGITEEEDAFIKKVWDTLDGSSCYQGALTKIARGET